MKFNEKKGKKWLSTLFVILQKLDQRIPWLGEQKEKAISRVRKSKKTTPLHTIPASLQTGGGRMDLHSARFDAINHNKKPCSPKDLQAKVHNLIWSEISQHHSWQFVVRWCRAAPRPEVSFILGLHAWIISNANSKTFCCMYKKRDFAFCVIIFSFLLHSIVFLFLVDLYRVPIGYCVFDCYNARLVSARLIKNMFNLKKLNIMVY